MKVIRAAFGDECYNSACGTAIFSGNCGGFDGELLESINRRSRFIDFRMPVAPVDTCSVKKHFLPHRLSAIDALGKHRRTSLSCSHTLRSRSKENKCFHRP